MLDTCHIFKSGYIVATGYRGEIEISEQRIPIQDYK